MNVEVPVFPAESVAEQVTVVSPNPNVNPEAGTQVTVGDNGATRSVAEGLKLTALPEGPVASTVMFDGNVRVGAVVSRTVTVNVEVPVFLAVSVAEQVTVVVPRTNIAPDAGAQVTVGDAGPTASEADGLVKVAVAPDGPVASTVTGP